MGEEAADPLPDKYSNRQQIPSGLLITSCLLGITTIGFWFDYNREDEDFSIRDVDCRKSGEPAAA